MPSWIPASCFMSLYEHDINWRLVYNRQRSRTWINTYTPQNAAYVHRHISEGKHSTVIFFQANSAVPVMQFRRKITDGSNYWSQPALAYQELIFYMMIYFISPTAGIRIYITRSIPRLLMTWLSKFLGHQQPCYWLCQIKKSLSFTIYFNDVDLSMLRNGAKCKYIFMFHGDMG